MDRLELIESDEYIESSVDLMVRSTVGIRVIRRDLKVSWINHKDELKKVYEQHATIKCIEVLEVLQKQFSFKDRTYNLLEYKISELKALLNNPDNISEK